jgi:hypothetical protein
MPLTQPSKPLKLIINQVKKLLKLRKTDYTNWNCLRYRSKQMGKKLMQLLSYESYKSRNEKKELLMGKSSMKKDLQKMKDKEGMMDDMPGDEKEPKMKKKKGKLAKPTC